MVKRKYISTTIKKEWLDKILDGTKTVEYKGDTPFWCRRIVPIKYLTAFGKLGINFPAGWPGYEKCYKFEVPEIEYIKGRRVIDGQTFEACFAIHLGRRIVPPDASVVYPDGA